MHYKIPTIKFVENQEKDNETQVIISPLNSGYGTTIGNTLRRTLLSSIPGHTIIAFKIDGVNHEFDTIENIQEDVLEILLNLKQVDLKIDQDELIVSVEVKNAKSLTTADFGSQVEVFGPTQTIITFNDPMDFKMDIIIKRGVGYAQADEFKENLPVGFLAIDAIFSPIKQVSFSVEKTRIGKDSNYDQLIMDVKTNGAVTVGQALASAGKILVEHFLVVQNFENYLVEEEIFVPIEEEQEEEEIVQEVSIEELGLTSRSLNALYKHNITTLSDLADMTIEEIKNINNLGAKSQAEIIEKLKEHGIEK